MHNEAIKREMNCHLKIDILTLGKAVEHSNLTTRFRDWGDITDLCVMGVICAILRVSDVFAHKFKFLCQYKFSLRESLKHI